jgi:hypothetical protein
LPKEAVIRTQDFGAGDFSDLKRGLAQEPVDCSGFHAETIGSIRIERRLRQVSWADLPFGALLREMVGEWREVFIPVALGALRQLEGIRSHILKPGGRVRIFDTGFAGLSTELNQSFYFAAQLATPGVGSQPAFLSFPALGLWGRQQGWHSTIRSQESLVKRVSGKTVFDPVPFQPRLSGRKLIRHVSRPGAPFNPSYWMNGEPKSAARAFELDFLVGGVFERLLAGESASWLPTDYEPVQRALTQLGYDTKRVFADLFDNPYYAHLWIVDLTA